MGQRLGWRGFVLLGVVVGIVGLARVGWTNAGDPTETQNYLPIVQLQPTPTVTPSPTPSAPPSGTVTPNDPHFATEQWPLQTIRAPQGWAITTGTEVIVAVIDTGVDTGHPDLAAQLVAPSEWRNLTSDNGGDPANPQDGHGHGTHVAGIAAAASNNGQGIAGISWGARILPIKALSDGNGGGTYSAVTNAIRYATDHGARIINLSLGGGCLGTDPMQSAINDARARGVTVIAAAGNYYQQGNPVQCPAALAGVVAVAATTQADGRAFYSNTGDYVDVAAPGGDSARAIFSTFPRGLGGYAAQAGTSMAAPHVAGLAALLLSEQPSLTPDDVEYLIEETSTDLGEPGWDPSFGRGRIDARYALEIAWFLRPPQSPLMEPAPRFGPATDCAIAHAPDQVVVRQTPAAQEALRAVLGDAPRVVQGLGAWQVVRVADGRACATMQALNAAGQGQVAELDPLFTLPDPPLP